MLALHRASIITYLTYICFTLGVCLFLFVSESENGVSEASSPLHENVGFMAYNALAGGYLTGKYFTGPPATYDNPSFKASQVTR